MARRFIRAAAMLCIVVAVGMLAVIGWVQYSSNQQAKAQQKRADQLTQQWDTSTVSGSGASVSGSLALGQPLGVMRIPALGADWERPVVEGTGLPQLQLGIGHYTGTALPGQVGNFGIAGHSSGHGAPYGDLDKVKPGDLMTVQTPSATYTYRMVSSRVVKPTDVAVLNPTPTATMTVTTCYPVYAINPDRLVVSAVLVPDSSQP